MEIKIEKDAGEKMKNKYDVKEYFTMRGYDVEISKYVYSHKTYVIKKGNEKKTVIAMDAENFKNSLPEEIYDILMNDGLIAVIPQFADDQYQMEIYSKDDINEAHKSYYIFWKHDHKRRLMVC